MSTAPQTDHARAKLALQLVRTARSGLHRALTALANPDDAGLLSAPPDIDRAIALLEFVSGDLEGELERIESDPSS